MSEAHHLARLGNATALAYLFDHDGLDPNATDERGFSLLMIAAYNNQLPATELILARGADPDLRDARGNTVLMGMAFKGHLGPARALLTAGADASIANAEGQTALTMARQFGHAELAALLEGAAGPDHPGPDHPHA